MWGEAPAPPLAPSSPAAQITPRRLTREGYYVSTPRYAGDGRIVYGRQNPDDFPAVAVIDFETAPPKAEPQAPASAHGASVRPRRSLGAGGPAWPAAGRRLAIRYGGEQVSLRGRIVFFDAADYQVNVAWRSDLYAADTETGRVQRLTRDARLVAPDVSPDGRSLACISMAGGGRRLVVYGIEGTEVGRLALSVAPTPLDEADAAYGSPRWSPDGMRLAVERRRAGGPSEIVVIDVGIGPVVLSSPAAPTRATSHPRGFPTAGPCCSRRTAAAAASSSMRSGSIRARHLPLQGCRAAPCRRRCRRTAAAWCTSATLRPAMTCSRCRSRP